MSEFFRRTDRPTTFRQRWPESKDDMGELRVLADGAVDLRLASEILRNTQQLGLGVADIESREAPLAILPHALVPGEAVLDLTKTREVVRRRRALGNACHAERVAGSAQYRTERHLSDAGRRQRRV